MKLHPQVFNFLKGVHVEPTFCWISARKVKHRGKKREDDGNRILLVGFLPNKITKNLQKISSHRKPCDGDVVTGTVRPWAIPCLARLDRHHVSDKSKVNDYLDTT